MSSDPEKKKPYNDSDMAEWRGMVPVLRSWKDVTASARTSDNPTYFTDSIIYERLKKQLSGDLKLSADKKLQLCLDLDSAELKEDPKKNDLPSESISGSVSNMDAQTLASPCSIFMKLFSENLLTLIVENTKAYAASKARFGDISGLFLSRTNTELCSENGWTPDLNVSIEEMKLFIGFNLWMADLKLPNIRDYWSTVGVLSRGLIAPKWHTVGLKENREI